MGGRPIPRNGGKNAEELGLQLITSLHGTAVVANALKDPKVIDCEINRLKSWIKKL